MKILFTITFLVAAAYAVAQEKKSVTRQRFVQAEEAYNDGKYTEALALFNKSLKEDPGNADGYRLRAATREQLNDLEGANTDYAIFLEMVPDQPEALYSLATIRFRLGLYDQARQDFMKLLTLPPGPTNTIYFRQGATVAGKNQVMTMQSPMTPQLYNYLGMVETKQKNYAKAVAWLDSAIHLEKKDADFYVNRGIAKEGLNDSTAILDYRRALAINPDNTVAIHNIAILKGKQGANDEALNQLELAIDNDSSMLHPYLERARQRSEAGFFKGALDDYNKALSIDARDPKIWLNRGYVKERLNDLAGAFSDYTHAIDLDEKYDKAWLNRGNVLNKQGRYKEAIEDYTVALIYNPGFASAYFNRAIAKQKLKLPAEACEDLKQAEALGQAVPAKMKSEFCK